MYILVYKWNMYYNLNLYICKDVLEEIYGFKLVLKSLKLKFKIGSYVLSSKFCIFKFE